MTYKYLKNLVTGLLIGDMKPPVDNDDVMIPLLEKAMLKIAAKAQVLRLMTTSKDEGVYRTADGDYMIRFPKMPEKDNDTLDIDHELGFAAASFIASFICKPEMKAYHEKEALDIIEHYNIKYDSIIRQIREKYNMTTNSYEAGLPREY